LENLKKRKASGGRRIPYRGRRAYEKDGYPLETTLGPMKMTLKRGRGGRLRNAAVRIEHANVTDPSTHISKKVKIVRVVSNPANRDYERRGVITKGAVIETELGRARVVSRPSQDGVVNALLVQK